MSYQIGFDHDGCLTYHNRVHQTDVHERVDNGFVRTAPLTIQVSVLKRIRLKVGWRVDARGGLSCSFGPSQRGFALHYHRWRPMQPLAPPHFLPNQHALSTFPEPAAQLNSSRENVDQTSLDSLNSVSGMVLEKTSIDRTETPSL